MLVTIVSRIYRPEPAAASFFLGAVADALRAAGHDVVVLTTTPPKGHPATPSGERVRRWPVLRDRNGYVRGYVQYMSFDLPLALRLLFARRPAVVLVEPPPTTGAVVRVVCALRRIPYVYDAADVWSDAARLTTRSRTVLRVLRRLEAFAMGGAAQLVTISQSVVERARALGVTRPFTVTGFGADTSAFAEAVAAAPAQLFVYAGSYSAWHGAEILIPAFAEFSRTHPGYTLRFIGNGSERPAMERDARMRGLGSSVQFLDPVAPAALAPQLGSAVASLATLKPGTGYEYAFTSKAYSSMASGSPVIFAGPGPTASFIEGAGAEVRAGLAVPYEAEAIADAMRAFADRPIEVPERSALAAWTAERHSLAAVASRVAAVVADVGGRRSRA